jgi:hypothetical protein
MVGDKWTEDRTLLGRHLAGQDMLGDKRTEDRTLLGRHLAGQDMLGDKRTENRPLQVDILLDRTCWETRGQRIGLF